MRALRALVARVMGLFQRRDAELDEDIKTHLDFLTEEHGRSGMSPQEARLAARRSFGGLLQTKEAYRRQRGLPAVENLIRDIRHAVRVVRRDPGFALTAILSIGLAIGVNAALFSLADAMVLRPLPVPQPSDVVTLSTRGDLGRPTPFGPVSYPDYLEFRDANRAFEDVAAFRSLVVAVSAGSEDQPQLAIGLAVTPNFFNTLRVTPPVGRRFLPTEGLVPGRDPIVIVSYDLWNNVLGGDPSVLGRSLRLNGVPFSVVGVAPESFTGVDLFVRPAFYVPVTMAPALSSASASSLLTDRELRVFDVKGRLKPRVSLSMARSEAQAVFSALQQRYPETNRGIDATVRTELQARIDEDPFTAYLLGLLGVLVVFVLAMACGNVANLVASRMRSRGREIVLRLAIGASRRRIVHQLMVESLLIALAGGVVGVLLAGYSIRLFSLLDVPGDVPIAPVFQLNLRILLFTCAVSVVGAILFGLLPALHSVRTDLTAVLKGRPSAPRHERRLVSAALVAVQIAGSLVLVIAGVQLSRGIASALDVDIGYRPDHRLTMRIDPSLAGYDQTQRDRFYERLLEGARQLDGVRSATLSSWIPMADGWGRLTVVPEGFQFPSGQDSASVLINTVDEHYFATLGVPIVSGRGFERTDVPSAPAVIVVNEAFANSYLGPAPLGRRVRLVNAGQRIAEVVGVTPTGKYISALEQPIPFVYLPFSQHPQSRMTMTLETVDNPAVMASPLRELVRQLDPGVPVFGVQTLQDVFDRRSRTSATLIRGLITFVGVLGLSLAVTGLYAIVSYQVNQRTREIGVRMALGAGRRQMMVMTLTRAGVLAGAGIALGLPLSAALGPALAAFGTRPGDDLAVTTLASAFILVIALLAAAIPAYRAATVDPMVALRCE